MWLRGKRAFNDYIWRDRQIPISFVLGKYLVPVNGFNHNKLSKTEIIDILEYLYIMNASEVLDYEKDNQKIGDYLSKCPLLWIFCLCYLC